MLMLHVTVGSSILVYRLPLLTPYILLVCYSLQIKNLLVCIFDAYQLLL